MVSMIYSPLDYRDYMMQKKLALVPRKVILLLNLSQRQYEKISMRQILFFLTDLLITVKQLFTGLIVNHCFLYKNLQP